MTNLFASEGGYQLFELGSAEWFWLTFSLVVSLLALGVGAIAMKGVLAKPTGTAEMEEIAGAVQEGAMAYITRQFRTIGVIVIPLAIIVFFTSREVLNATGEGLSFVQSGGFRTLAFIVGGTLSASIGFLGMWLSTRANVRTATCLLYTSDAADDLLCVDLGGRRINNKKKNDTAAQQTTNA